MELSPYIHTLSIKPNYLAVYKQYLQPKRNYKPYDPLTFRLHANAHNGILSSHSAKKIKTAVNWLVATAKEKKVKSFSNEKIFQMKLNFVTLTLSSRQLHNDNVIKSCLLNQFLIEARKKWNLKNYVWRAEKQKNGNIHFHIITDVFIPWYELRQTWNRLQNKLRYIDNYRQEMQNYHSAGFRVRKDLLKNWAYKNQLRAYKFGNKNDWQNPNSVDVHSIRKIKNLSGYICKYMTKNVSNVNSTNNELTADQLITGRLYGLSYSLSKLIAPGIEIDAQLSSELDLLVKENSVRELVSQHYTVFLTSTGELSPDKFPLITSIFFNFIKAFQNST